MTLEQLKQQILARQHLTAPADKLAVCGDLNGIQAQFLSHSLQALRLRCAQPLPDTGWGGGLVKNWTVRGTIHVFSQRDLPVFLHEGRTNYLRPVDRLVADDFITLPRKQYFASCILEGIAAGTDTREGLKQLCFARGMTEREAQSVFDPWGGTIRYLAETGQICHKVQQAKAFMPCPPFTPLPQPAARQEQLRRYFTHYGPATVRDAAYFFAWPQAEVRAHMKALPLLEIVFEGEARYFLPAPQGAEASVPLCLFLAGFDPLLLGYHKQHSLFLPPEHLRGIFSLSGIVHPAVLLRGEVAARWKRDKAKLLVTPLRPLSPAERSLVRQAAEAAFTPLSAIEFTE